MAEEAKAGGAGGETAPAPAPAKKGTLMWVIIGLLVLLIAGGGGAFAWLKFKTPHKAEAKTETTQPAEPRPAEAAQEPAAAAEKGGEGEKGGPPGKLGTIVDLDPFIVNLADQEPRYLKLTIKLEVEGPELKAEILQRVPQVRDSLLVLLSSKESVTLKPATGKLQLRDEILQRINSLLASGKARNVYFTEFVVQ
jgi:flagellar FliL protein